MGMDGEIWKGTEHPLYSVSNYGRVIGPRGRILRPCLTGGGKVRGRNGIYPTVDIHYADGSRKSVMVHILVARTFLGDCPPNHEVNHKDADPSNPRLDNLEYRTIHHNRGFSSGCKKQRRVNGKFCSGGLPK